VPVYTVPHDGQRAAVVDLLRAVCDGERTKFFCESCVACWLLEVGWAIRVDPKTCPGCAHQPQCLAADSARQPTH
jgi:hypothetical protein